MTAGVHNITIEQGATFSLPLTWNDGNGTAINLTGFTARMKVRPTVDSATTLVSLTTENGGIALGGIAGTVTVTIDATATAAMTTGGVYDLELVSAGGVVTRLLQGSAAFSKEVTR